MNGEKIITSRHPISLLFCESPITELLIPEFNIFYQVLVESFFIVLRSHRCIAPPQKNNEVFFLALGLKALNILLHRPAGPLGLCPQVSIFGLGVNDTEFEPLSPPF
jgi:hypothetical protein